MTRMRAPLVFHKGTTENYRNESNLKVKSRQSKYKPNDLLSLGPRYSLRNESTGFPAAAWNDLKLMERKAMIKVVAPAAMNIHHAIPVW